MKIIIQNMQKRYGLKKILFDINLSIALDNKIIGLVGPNGAGKSTLMRVLSGVLLPNSGSIETADIAEKTSYIRWALANTVYVPAGDRGLINKLTVIDNFKYFCGLKNMDYRQNLDTFEKTAKLFKMEDLLNRNYDKMSTGQKKSAALLNAMALKTKMILLDEPSNGLDIDAQDELKDILNKAKKKANQKIIISSHDVNLLTSVCDQYIFIRGGHIIGGLNTQTTQEELVNLYHQSFRKGTTL